MANKEPSWQAHLTMFIIELVAIVAYLLVMDDVFQGTGRSLFRFVMSIPPALLTLAMFYTVWKLDRILFGQEDE